MKNLLGIIGAYAFFFGFLMFINILAYFIIQIFNIESTNVIILIVFLVFCSVIMFLSKFLDR